MTDDTESVFGDELPREVFAQQLTSLWRLAGGPTLQAVADAANRVIRSSRGEHAKRLTVQRISDWRKGRNLPANFESVRPVLFVLFELARKSEQVPPALLDPTHWRQLWVSAVSWTPTSDCPYRGLESYRTENAALFFGRERATAELVALVRKTGGAGGGIVVLVGASGTGKSSLLAAGLIPGLGPEWTVRAGTPSTPPSMEDIPADNSALVIDQFEELFTNSAAAADQLDFIETLTRHADSGATVVLGLRADFFARCLDHPALAEAVGRRAYVLTPMLAAELTEAITRPARAHGLKLESGLVELISAELLGLGGRTDGSGTLPLLSHVMAVTWERGDGNRLTLDAYRAAGGVTGSVARTAQQAWARLDSTGQDAARSILLSLVTVGSDTRDTRRHLPITELLTRTDNPDAAADALEQLASARLITLDTDTTALTHEIVIDAWPELRGWIDADRAGHLIRQRAETDAAEWVSSGRSRALLYHGDRLAQARTHGRAVAGQTREFLTAALRARRQRTWMQAGLAGTLVLLLVAALTGYVNTRIANREKDAGFFANVLSEASRVQSSDPTLSAELDILAATLRPDDLDVASRLIGTQSLPAVAAFAADTGMVSMLAYADGDILATAGADRSIRLWNTSNPGAVVPAGPAITDHTGTVTALTAFGTLLISGGDDRTVRIRDISDPARPRESAVIDTGSPLAALALAHDGRTLAVADPHGVELYDLTDPAHPVHRPTRFPVDGQLVTLGFTSDDRTLLTIDRVTPNAAAQTRTLRAWNTVPTQDDPHGTVLGQSADIRMVTSPAGNLVAIADDRPGSSTAAVDSEVRLVRVDGADHTVPIGSSFAASSAYFLLGMAFGPDGRTLATLTAFGTSLWNLTDPSRPVALGPLLTGNAAACPRAPAEHRCTAIPLSLRFSRGGQTLAVGFEDGTVQQWLVPPAVLGGQAGQVRPVISADGSRMLTFAPGADAHIWDTHDPAAVRLAGTVPAPQDRLPGLAVTTLPSISSDGAFAGLVLDGAMTLIDISDPAKPVAGYRFPNAIGLGFAIGRPLLITISASPPSFQAWNYADAAHPVPLGLPVQVQISPKVAATGVQVTTTRDGELIAVLTDKLMVWDADIRKLGPPGGSVAADWSGGGLGIAVTPDHRTAIAASDFGLVRRWDISDPTRIEPLGEPFRASEVTVTALDLSADGRLLATGGTDSTVRLWNFADPAHPVPYGQSLTPPTATPWQVVFHPKANYLFGGGDNGALRVWDLDPRHAVTRLCGLLGTRINADLADHFPAQALPRLCG
ncbi:AAA family ATPase [Nocardia sp. NBC_01503]|uniref:NACHT and WD repeat domain-containing protein n=1 Tax=Nocardia sp. NBC_01503 TaxID=2975997 RepID=UPI002E7C09E8|nr:AAA family ATPase [Nocardia sp. NBC_01503]WTL31646.1 AAA family ATPase [Nocardia sp. NBC_01503]